VHFAPYRTPWAETLEPPPPGPSLVRRWIHRMRAWLLRTRRRRALSEYIARLGPALIARYGEDEHYAPGRIRRTVSTLKLSERFVVHAVAMYASADQFVDDLRDGERADAAGLRKLYAMLRSDAAELANGASFRFLPKVWHDIGMNNGSNADAVRRWGVPM
jgi:hypothetical protein